MRRVTHVATPIAHLVGPGKLAVTNGQLVYRPNGEGSEGPLRLSPEALRTVYCYGAVGVSEDAFTVLCHHDIEVAFLTAGGCAARAGWCMPIPRGRGFVGCSTRRSRRPSGRRMGRANRHGQDRQPADGGAALPAARRSRSETGDGAPGGDAETLSRCVAGIAARLRGNGGGGLVRVARHLARRAVAIHSAGAPAADGPGQRAVEPGIHLGAEPHDRALRGRRPGGQPGRRCTTGGRTGRRCRAT